MNHEITYSWWLILNFLWFSYGFPNRIPTSFQAPVRARSLLDSPVTRSRSEPRRSRVSWARRCGKGGRFGKLGQSWENAGFMDFPGWKQPHVFKLCSVFLVLFSWVFHIFVWQLSLFVEPFASSYVMDVMGYRCFWLNLLVLSREWGNGMIINSYYRSLPHSLLRTSQ